MKKKLNLGLWTESSEEDIGAFLEDLIESGTLNTRDNEEGRMIRIRVANYTVTTTS